MSVEQRLTDFQSLAALFAKQYAPYEWKRATLGYDLFDLRPWLDRVRRSKDDLEFHEISAEYVAALKDIHSQYFVPSSFVATLGLDGDLYDGKMLIDTISRRRLPLAQYPFVVGDEIVSVDGRTPEQWIEFFNRFQSFGNKRSSDRWSAGYIAYRSQAEIPRAAEIGDTASVVIRRQDGSVATYEIPWEKSGEPLVNSGRVGNTRNSDETVEPGYQRMPSYLRPLLEMQQLRPMRRLSAKGFGALAPVFKLPDSFVARRSSFFYTGVYEAEGKRFGFLRIGDFQPVSFDALSFVYSAFDREMRFLQANTDALIVDVMRNPGGYGCYAEELFRRLTPNRFYVATESIRPTTRLLATYQTALQDAKDSGVAEEWEIAMLGEFKRQLEEANGQNRGMTGPIPLCGLTYERDPVSLESDNITPYTKPVVLLTDEFTTSAGDLFAALFQEAKRGPIVGWRTAGAGGAVESRDAGSYSEGFTGMTVSLLTRRDPVAVPGYPTTWFVENVGVHPDVQVDFMTKDNLLSGGRDFVTAFTEVALKEIQKAQP